MNGNEYPLPYIDNLIDRLVSKKLFIKMDIWWGYDNVRIHEGVEWKTAFICKYGLYEPLIMFFGLTNSPATFQFMNTIFDLKIAQQWLNDYLDDLLIGNEGNKEDLTRRQWLCSTNVKMVFTSNQRNANSVEVTFTGNRAHCAQVW